MIGKQIRTNVKDLLLDANNKIEWMSDDHNRRYMPKYWQALDKYGFPCWRPGNLRVSLVGVAWAQETTTLIIGK